MTGLEIIIAAGFIMPALIMIAIGLVMACKDDTYFEHYLRDETDCKNWRERK